MPGDDDDTGKDCAAVTRLEVRGSALVRIHVLEPDWRDLPARAVTKAGDISKPDGIVKNQRIEQADVAAVHEAHVRRACVHPVTHFASQLDDENLPRIGERPRARPRFDLSGFPPPVQAMLKGLKKHGMFVADNGIDRAVSVTPDPRLPALHKDPPKIKGANFEVVVAPE